MSSLLLCLAGPTQAWGIEATRDYRPTRAHPTLSGIIGMLSAAQGLPRKHATSWVDEHLELSVRVDKPGTITRDYHTANTDGDMPKYPGQRHTDTIVSEREYLDDARFIAALTHPNTDLITHLADAIQHPTWAPSLGRRACTPALPLYLGVTHQTLTPTWWETLPPLTTSLETTHHTPGPTPNTITLTLLTTSTLGDPHANHINDHPLHYGLRNRSYRPRSITTHNLTIPTHTLPTPKPPLTLLHQHHAITQHLTSHT